MGEAVKHYTFTHVKGTDMLWFARGLCDSDDSIVHDVGTADEAQAAAIARSMQAAYNKGLEMASRMMLEHMRRVLPGRGELSQERHAGGWLVSLRVWWLTLTRRTHRWPRLSAVYARLTGARSYTLWCSRLTGVPWYSRPVVRISCLMGMPVKCVAGWSKAMIRCLLRTWIH